MDFQTHSAAAASYDVEATVASQPEGVHVNGTAVANIILHGKSTADGNKLSTSGLVPGYVNLTVSRSSLSILQRQHTPRHAQYISEAACLVQQ